LGGGGENGGDGLIWGGDGLCGGISGVCAGVWGGSQEEV